jgi:redox-regulated HSP33 family molecular chaperone
MLNNNKIRSTIGLSIGFDEQGNVTKALGFLCSALPGCTDEEFDILSRNSLKLISNNSESVENDSSVNTTNTTTTTVGENEKIRYFDVEQFEDYQDFSLHYNSAELVESLLNELGQSLNVIEPVLLYCSCSQATALRTARMLSKSSNNNSSSGSGQEEAVNKKDIEVTCEWCGKCYMVPPASADK